MNYTKFDNDPKNDPLLRNRGGTGNFAGAEDFGGKKKDFKYDDDEDSVTSVEIDEFGQEKPRVILDNQLVKSGRKSEKTRRPSEMLLSNTDTDEPGTDQP